MIKQAKKYHRGDYIQYTMLTPIDYKLTFISNFECSGHILKSDQQTLHRTKYPSYIFSFLITPYTDGRHNTEEQNLSLHPLNVISDWLWFWQDGENPIYKQFRITQKGSMFKLEGWDQEFSSIKELTNSLKTFVLKSGEDSFTLKKCCLPRLGGECVFSAWQALQSDLWVIMECISD